MNTRFPPQPRVGTASTTISRQAEEQELEILEENQTKLKTRFFQKPKNPTTGPLSQTEVSESRADLRDVQKNNELTMKLYHLLDETEIVHGRNGGLPWTDHTLNQIAVGKIQPIPPASTLPLSIPTPMQASHYKRGGFENSCTRGYHGSSTTANKKNWFGNCISSFKLRDSQAETVLIKYNPRLIIRQAFGRFFPK